MIAISFSSCGNSTSSKTGVDSDSISVDSDSLVNDTIITDSTNNVVK